MIPAQHAQKWSDDDILEMARLVLLGHTAKEVAPHFPDRGEYAVEACFKRTRKAYGLQQVRGIRTDGIVRAKLDDELIAESDANYTIARRIDAERGCRLLKQAMDRYYINRPQAA